MPQKIIIKSVWDKVDAITGELLETYNTLGSLSYYTGKSSNEVYHSLAHDKAYDGYKWKKRNLETYEEILYWSTLPIWHKPKGGDWECYTVPVEGFEQLYISHKKREAYAISYKLSAEELPDFTGYHIWRCNSRYGITTADIRKENLMSRIITVTEQPYEYVATYMKEKVAKEALQKIKKK